jgi:ubiquinone/menaquinone biosynthesis C-methylase UbiE
VGAGDGEWSEILIRGVGESGHVYVTEIDEEELTKIRERLRDLDLRNVSVIVGEPDDTMLPDSCCDAILLRMVFHHMDDPEAMSSSLRRSIRTGGRLLVIDQYEHYGHGVAPEILTEKMEAAAFRMISQHLEWNDDDHFAILFRAVGEPPPSRKQRP